MNWINLPFGDKKVFTVVSGVVEGYLSSRLIIFAQIFTGHRVGSDVRCCVIVSFLVSLFCASKVIDTVSAECRLR